MQNLEPWQEFALKVLLLVIGSVLVMFAFLSIKAIQTAQNIEILGYMLISATALFRHRRSATLEFLFVALGIIIAVILAVIAYLNQSNPNYQYMELAAVAVFIYVVSRLWW